MLYNGDLISSTAHLKDATSHSTVPFSTSTVPPANLYSATCPPKRCHFPPLQCHFPPLQCHWPSLQCYSATVHCPPIQCHCQTSTKMLPPGCQVPNLLEVRGAIFSWSGWGGKEGSLCHNVHFTTPALPCKLSCILHTIIFILYTVNCKRYLKYPHNVDPILYTIHCTHVEHKPIKQSKTHGPTGVSRELPHRWLVYTWRLWHVDLGICACGSMAQPN